MDDDTYPRTSYRTFPGGSVSIVQSRWRPDDLLERAADLAVQAQGVQAMKAGELYILRATIHPPQVRVLNVRDGAVQYVYTYGGMPGEIHETTYRGFGMLFKRDKRVQNVIQEKKDVGS